MNGEGSRPMIKIHRPTATTHWRFGGIEPSHTFSTRANCTLMAVTPQQIAGFGIQAVEYSVALFGAIAILGLISNISILR